MKELGFIQNPKGATYWQKSFDDLYISVLKTKGNYSVSISDNQGPDFTIVALQDVRDADDMKKALKKVLTDFNRQILKQTARLNNLQINIADLQKRIRKVVT
jgi:membrane protease subunit (stomatin/prohibitin family)